MATLRSDYVEGVPRDLLLDRVGRIVWGFRLFAVVLFQFFYFCRRFLCRLRGRGRLCRPLGGHRQWLRNRLSPWRTSLRITAGNKPDCERTQQSQAYGAWATV